MKAHTWWCVKHYNDYSCTLTQMLGEMVRSGDFFFNMRDFTEKRMDEQYANLMFKALQRPEKFTDEDLRRLLFTSSTSKRQKRPPPITDEEEAAVDHSQYEAPSSPTASERELLEDLANENA